MHYDHTKLTNYAYEIRNAQTLRFLPKLEITLNEFIPILCTILYINLS